MLPDEIVSIPCWELYPQIELDRRLLIQSFTTDDFIYLLSNNYFLKMDENGLLEDHLISESGNLSLSDYPMLNDKLFAIGFDRYNLESLEIFSTQNPNISSVIDLLAIDSSFQKINYFSGNGMCVNGSNKLLFSVYKEFVPDVPNPYLYFWMFDFTIENDNLTFEFDKEIKIEVPGSGGLIGEKGVTEMVVYENEFYCSTNNPVMTYKINSQGEYEALFPMRDARIFSRNDTLFALGHDLNCNINYSFKPPQNNYWETFMLGVYDGCWGKFYQIGRRFVVVNRDQFWELTINHSDAIFDIKELDGNCLQPSLIRSLFEFKDQTYFVTSDGLYFKDQKDFFIHKEE